MSMNYLFGIDDYGCDLFSCLVVGFCVILFVILFILFFIVVVGVFLGLFVGYKKGWIDMIIMWIIDIGLSILEFVIMIVLVSFFYFSFWNLVIVIIIIKWMNYICVIRGIVNIEMN